MKMNPTLIHWILVTLLATTPMVARSQIVGPCEAVANTDQPEFAISTAFDGTNFLVGVRGNSTNANAVNAQFLSPTGARLGSLIRTGHLMDGFANAPRLAFGSTNYLMAWSDAAVQHPSTGDDIYAQFISPAGNLVGNPFPVSTAGGSQYVLGAASDGDNFLVIWSDIDGLHGRRISPSGQLVGGELLFATDRSVEENGSVAYGGGQYLVAWVEGTDGAHQAMGRFVSTVGQLGSVLLLSQDDSHYYNPISVAFGGDRFLAVWHHNDGEDMAWDLRGRVVLSNGTLEGGELILAAGPREELAMANAVAFDGQDFLIAWTSAEYPFPTTNCVFLGQYWSRSGAAQSSPFVIDGRTAVSIGVGLSSGQGTVMTLINSGLFAPEADVCARVIQPARATSFTLTGSMTTNRENHTATKLHDGTVLVVGGITNADIGGTLASAEVYNSGSGTWTATGSLTAPRNHHTATLLLNGKVLVAGGNNDETFALSSAELYDPESGKWTVIDSMHTARAAHTATLLPNGTVLVAGGGNATGGLSSAEVYDPSTGVWTTTGSLTTKRVLHSATLLANGQVLVAGGTLLINDRPGPAIPSAELYDPATGNWTATGAPNTPRGAFHTATLLSNGNVLFVAGDNDEEGPTDSAEMYDPITGSWTTTGSLTTGPRHGHTATLLPNGQVLVAGGSNDGELVSAELYDPATGSWIATGSLNMKRQWHTANLLPNGCVLIAGGTGGEGPGEPAIAGTELYDATAWIPTAVTLSCPLKSASGAFHCTFTSNPNGENTVLATTNVAFPHDQWSVLGVVPEFSPGLFLFAAPQATNAPQQFYRLAAFTNTPLPPNMVLIPAGSFTMGDTFNEGYGDELPTHTVYVSGFYMDQYKVTKALWDEVYNWATTNGYSFDDGDSGQGKAANHPAHTMTWYDAVKWCNARSEKEGLTPAYYTDSGLTTRYRSGQVTPYVNWNTSGYRLPTEAEWEKAARGGASGHRFPLSDSNTITHSRANYYSESGYIYDTSPTRGYHPTFATGGYPYTSPVGYFATNGYGVYDMAGNLWEWCWDWYGSSYYVSSPSSNPRGPESGSFRVSRGGSWLSDADYCRAASRLNYDPARMDYDIGFRSVRAAGQ